MQEFLYQNEIPYWVWILCGMVAIFIGQCIRWLLRRRKAAALEKEREQRKADKKMLKREQKLLKKTRRNK